MSRFGWQVRIITDRHPVGDMARIAVWRPVLGGEVEVMDGQGQRHRLAADEITPDHLLIPFPSDALDELRDEALRVAHADPTSATVAALTEALTVERERTNRTLDALLGQRGGIVNEPVDVGPTVDDRLATVGDRLATVDDYVREHPR